MTDYSKMTPPEIDAVLVKNMTERERLGQVVETRSHHAGIFRKRLEQYSDPVMADGPESDYFRRQIAKVKKDLTDAHNDAENAIQGMEQANVVINECKTEFERRGGWSRYYLVLNTNGHIHSSTYCSTTFPTTSWAWLTEQAGMDENELVELAGKMACTVCFPDAPVDVLRRESQLEAPERKQAREEREQQKAERDRKKAEKAITNPDGSVLKLTGRFGDKVKTVHEAERILVSNLTDAMAVAAEKYVVHNPDFMAEKQADNHVLLTALAHKHADRLGAENKTTEDLLNEYQERAQKKFKRDWK